MLMIQNKVVSVYRYIIEKILFSVQPFGPSSLEIVQFICTNAWVFCSVE